MHIKIPAYAIVVVVALSPFVVGAAKVPAGNTDTSAPFSQYQPGLVVSQLLAIEGVYPSRNGESGVEYMGQVRSFAGNFGAFGAPEAQGQLIPIVQNPALFTVLGTRYGGDGRTNFALPDLVGTTVVGQGAGPGLSSYSNGEREGSATTTLTQANLPPRDHALADGGAAGTAGSATPFDNREPSLAMTWMIDVSGYFPSRGPAGVSHAFLGEVSQFAGDFAPPGWAPADGRLMPIAGNEALFSILGTIYGGDGDKTFGLPDLRGRTVVGAGQGARLTPVALGEHLGTESTTLTIATTPSDNHAAAGGVEGGTGGSKPFDTVQPSLGLTYLIALQGFYPTKEGHGSIPDDTPYIGEIQAFAGGFAPGGWALADGRLLSISDNDQLFTLIGTTFGGDGITTFALPDLRGRSLLGAGRDFTVGEDVGGDETSLTGVNLPSHLH